MGAPGKQGLDYFPLSVDLPGELKLRRPKMRFGYLATVVYISLLSLLYRDKGYYIDYSDKDAVVWQILSDLQGKWQPCQETVEECISALVACELFSGDLYQRQVITSRSAQINYYRATVTRKTVDIDDSLWLLDMAEMKRISAKHCYYLKRLGELNNRVNRPINEVNQPDNPQSKVKDIYTGAVIGEPENAEAYAKAADLFGSIKGAPLSPFEIDRTVELVDDYGLQWVLDALREMGNNGVVKINYAEAVLARWRAEGRSARITPPYGGIKPQGSRKQAESEDDRRAEIMRLMEEADKRAEARGY